MHASAILSRTSGIPLDRLFSAGDASLGRLGLGPAIVLPQRQFTAPAEFIDGMVPSGAATSQINAHAVQVCSGWDFSCAIYQTTGTTPRRMLYCAGNNADGQLGVGSWVRGSFSRYSPVLGAERDSQSVRRDTAFAAIDFKSVACGGSHALAVTTDGRLYGWGSNTAGQLGLGAAAKNAKLATAISLPSLAAGDAVATVAAGYAHSIVVTKNGAVYGFGSNAEGALGFATGSGAGGIMTPTLAVGALAALGPRIVALSAGGYHTMAVVADDTQPTDQTLYRVWTWGEGTSGQTGHPPPTGVTGQRWFQREPKAVAALANTAVSQVAAGFKHSAVLSTCKQAILFGHNAFGELGDGGGKPANSFRATAPQLVPSFVTWNLRVESLCAGAFATYAIAQSLDNP